MTKKNQSSSSGDGVPAQGKHSPLWPGRELLYQNLARSHRDVLRSSDTLIEFLLDDFRLRVVSRADRRRFDRERQAIEEEIGERLNDRT